MEFNHGDSQYSGYFWNKPKPLASKFVFEDGSQDKFLEGYSILVWFQIVRGLINRYL